MAFVKPTLRQMRAFVAVATQGSFTSAALELNLTQSALSALIRELETAVGLKLFHRTTRRVELSIAGETFLPRALNMLQDLDAAIGELNELQDSKRGIVRVAAPPLMACTFIPQAVSRLQAEHPGLEVILEDTLPERLLDAVQSARVDLAIGLEAETGPEIRQEVLFTVRHNLVCRPDHPLAKKNSVRWRDLASFPLIAPTRDFRTHALANMTGKDREWVQRPSPGDVSFVTTALGMVAAGLGISVCPDHARNLAGAFGLRMIDLVNPQWSRTVSLYNLSRRTHSPAAETFIKAVRSVR